MRGAKGDRKAKQIRAVAALDDDGTVLIPDGSGTGEKEFARELSILRAKGKSQSQMLWQTIADDDKSDMRTPNVKNQRYDFDNEEDGDAIGGYVLPRESVSGHKTNCLIVHPDNPTKVGFDFLIGFLILASVLAIPFQIGFRVPESPVIFILECIVDSFFALDIILNFMTAYFVPELGGLVQLSFLHYKLLFLPFVLFSNPFHEYS